MRKLNLISGALGLAALGLTACSNDDLKVMENQKAEVDETRYITVQISSPISDYGTRAALGSSGFNDGIEAESFVNRLDFFYFDVAGNPTAQRQPVTTFDGNAFTDLNADGNVTRFYTSVVPVQMAQGDNYPAQVLCIVNGDADALNNIENMTLEQIRDIEQKEITRGGNFLMTNSVYYGYNSITGVTNDRLCATPISKGQLFNTEQDAKTALNKATATGASDTDKAAMVDIYVERMAAKVGLTLASSASKSYTLKDVAGNEVTLNYTPEYWFMNASDKTSFLTKHYGVQENGEILWTPSYADIYSELTTNGGWNEWNDVTNHRSYWGTSPSYFDNAFPLVSDDVNDLEPGTEETEYSVWYMSYNEVVANEQATSKSVNQSIKADNGAFTASADGASGFVYCRETTTPMATINNTGTNGNPGAAVASAVIVGRYRVGNADAATTFYVDRNEGENGIYYANADAAKASLLARQQAIYVQKSENTGGTPRTWYEPLATNQEYLVLEHPKAAVRALLKQKSIAGRLVALQLNSVPTGANGPLYYYNGTAYVTITSENLNQANANLAMTGYIDEFNEGLGFYSIPIRHLNFDSDSYKDGKYLWADMNAGELGVVRNHIYNISVTSLSGLASALRSPEQPIVPAKETFNQYIGMKLNILSWNVVNTWTVSL